MGEHFRFPSFVDAKDENLSTAAMSAIQPERRRASVVGTEMSRRAEDCRKKAMECHHRAFACPDAALRVIYLDLVYQWRQIAEEFEVIERQQRRSATDCYD